jgi:hypothetical protein
MLGTIRPQAFCRVRLAFSSWLAKKKVRGADPTSLRLTAAAAPWLDPTTAAPRPHRHLPAESGAAACNSGPNRSRKHHTYWSSRAEGQAARQGPAATAEPEHRQRLSQRNRPHIRNRRGDRYAVTATSRRSRGAVFISGVDFCDCSSSLSNSVSFGSITTG